MKEAFILFIGFMLALGNVQAQDMRSLLIAMPDTIMPILTQNNRLDLVDFMESDMKAEVKNRFEHITELKTLTEDYLLMEMTEQSTIQLKLLPVNDSVKVICMVKTLHATVDDSEVAFFDTQWNRLNVGDYITMPDADAFYIIPTTNKNTYLSARDKADIDFVKATLFETENSIQFLYTTPDYLSEEDKKEVTPFLKEEPLVYRWEEGHFR